MDSATFYYGDFAIRVSASHNMNARYWIGHYDVTCRGNKWAAASITSLYICKQDALDGALSYARRYIENVTGRACDTYS